MEDKIFHSSMWIIIKNSKKKFSDPQISASEARDAIIRFTEYFFEETKFKILCFFKNFNQLNSLFINEKRSIFAQKAYP